MKSLLSSCARWWLPLSLLALFSLYLQGMQTKKKELKDLRAKEAVLTSELKAAELQSEELALTLRSQKDPAFVELVLKKELGMTPKGEQKVVFASPSPQLTSQE